MTRPLTLALALAAALGGCGTVAADRQATVISAPVIRQPASPEGQDVYAPRQARKERRDLEEMPGLQTLPYEGDGVRLTLVDVARDGRLVLRVAGVAEGQVRRGYRKWLARTGDTGRRYLPLYRWTALNRRVQGRR